jgi:hypothetical protein
MHFTVMGFSHEYDFGLPDVIDHLFIGDSLPIAYPVNRLLFGTCFGLVTALKYKNGDR